MPGIGDDKHYRLVFLDGAGEPDGDPILFDRISTVAKSAGDKSDALVGWAWNQITDGVSTVLQTIDMKGWNQEQVKAALKEVGAAPWQRRGKAADRGTRSHSILEQLAKGLQVDTSDIPVEELGYAESILKWWGEDAQVLEVLAAEHRVHSLTHRVAGRFDFYALRQREEFKQTVLTDLKTSKAVYAEHVIQADLYDLCIEEMQEMEAPWEHSILLAQEDGSKAKEFFFEPDTASAEAAIRLFRHMERNKGLVKGAK